MIGSSSSRLFLSVILPTFNRAELLQRCIDSILNQNEREFELIVVDDGSVDHTSEILQRYQDARLKVLYQDNQGVSSARNFGLRHALGEYITFIDSDDYIFQGFFRDAKVLLYQEGLDMLVYGGLSYPLNKRQIYRVPVFWSHKRKIQSFETISGLEYFRDFCAFSGNSWACAKFFHRDVVLKNLLHKEIHYGEDILLNLGCAYISNRVGLSHKRFYFYDSSRESLSRGKTISSDFKLQNLLLVHKELKKIISQQELWPYIAFNSMKHIVGNSLDFISVLKRKKNLEQEIEEILSEISDDLCDKTLKILRNKKLNFKLRCMTASALPFVCIIFNNLYRYLYQWVYASPLRRLKPRTRIRNILKKIKKNS
ncbi:glycosyltransferase family 2 protein [Helicobacter pametensis]|uniref:glycosyltransferase family 2 protein n=1 Tax=Helicobacter pametensis TaxID=95149 RepID=UPI0004810C9E|nr:glycosyltransferase family A protein [Helicobacter pametensis]